MKNCHSKAFWDRLQELQTLIERWNKGIKMLDEGKIDHQIALVRFAQLTDQIARVVDGYDHLPEVEFLLNQWMGGDWENSPTVQREIQQFLNQREDE